MADPKTDKDAGREETFAAFPVVEGDPPPEESFDDFPTLEPSVGQKLVAFGQAATGGLMESLPVGAGMLAGAGVGSLGGPVGTAVGATVGAEAGRRFGGAMREMASDVKLPSGTASLTVPSMSDFPPGLRPFAVAGEVVGQGSTIAAAPLALADLGLRLPPSKVGNFINRIIDTARRAPGTFAAAEVAGLTGGAIGAGAAEKAFPGDVPARVTGEIAGGMFNPGRIIIGATRGTADIVKQALETMTEAGRETRAAKVLREIVEDSGEDPEILADLLNNADLPGINPPRPTSAQATGSPALGALEAKLRQQSVEFGAESAKRAEDTLAFMRNAIQALRSTGDPQALRAAADIRDRYFRTLLAGRVQQAERTAAQAAARITADTPRVRGELSRNAQEAAQAALREVRGVERELWESVDRTIPSAGDNIVSQFDEIRADLLPEESMPAVVEGFVRRIRGQGTGDLPDEAQQIIADTFGDIPSVKPPGELPTTSGELLRFRSRALDLAREAQANNRFNEARILGQMAEAALDDLTAIGARGGGALDDARRFSRELHDTFTRTFAGQATARGRTGANRVPPELFLRSAFAQGREAADLRMREIEEATRFLARRGLDTPMSQQNLETVLDAQERMMRLVAAEAINPATGRASATRLGKFLRDNEALLDRFPEVRAEVRRAINAENGLQEALRLQTGATRAIDQQAAFARVAGFENPVDAIRASINGKSPIKDLVGLVKVAKRGGVEAEQGLKAAVWDHALRQADQGGFTFDKLSDALFAPVRPGQPSLADIMKRAGIVSQKTLSQTQDLIKRADDIVSAVQQGVSFEELIEQPDALLDLVLRVVGARIGVQGATGAAAGASLVAASAGSRFVRNMFNRVPQARVRDVLVEASLNPRFGAMLLRKAGSEAERVTLGRQIHAYMVQAGLVGFQDQPEDFDMNGAFSPEQEVPEAGQEPINNP